MRSVVSDDPLGPFDADGADGVLAGLGGEGGVAGLGGEGGVAGLGGVGADTLDAA
ncbi:hypothetical protein [Yoonia sp.]|uniref:hypothetical protein n=1 Tax=Yoonia sp. TaxID=2212373 RepID=UPI0025DFDF29|nr:hypothetical protein [Yoonia sp.]